MERKQPVITIRRGILADVDAILGIYDVARQYMRKGGNHAQWVNGYPSRELVLDDIRTKVSYVGENETGELVMAFAFIIGEDATYTFIEDGQWLNNRPYGTIHRLGSNGKHSGMLKRCVDFCFTKIDNLRLDTHADNVPMQVAAEQLGFARCGIIYCMDGTPRVAYQQYRRSDCL